MRRCASPHPAALLSATALVMAALLPASSATAQTPTPTTPAPTPTTPAPTTTAPRTPPDLTPYTTQHPTWTPCENNLECADITVPLNYQNPGTDHISVRISRLKASDPTRRRGVLMLNPGGPGGAGLTLPAFFARSAPAAVYDLIGFDPRGVGASTALNCRKAPVFTITDSRPADADFPKWAAEARAAEDACRRSGGGIRAHINTANTARDMEVIRIVLGEQKINFLGYSYGTYLGAVYGSLFPDRLDRSVLDSSVHPDWVWREQVKGQAVATRRNVDAWSEWVAARDPKFHLGKTAAEVIASVERVAARLVAQPIGGHTRTAFDAAVGTGARFRPLWGEIATAVRRLDTAAPATALHLLADVQQTELVPGVFNTVVCEADWPTDLETYYEDMRVFRERYPYGFGVARAAPATCTFRSFTPPEPPVQLRREGYPIGVVVQAEGDTQTQYESGPAMAARLGHSLITVVDEGKHGLYGSGNRCVTTAVDRYLVDGVLPDSHSTCPGDPRPSDDAPANAQSFVDSLRVGPLH